MSDTWLTHVSFLSWGSPPTPLVPQWHRDRFPDHPLPDQLRAAVPSVKTVGDLTDFWNHTYQPVPRSVLAILSRWFPAFPPPDHVVIPAGVDHAQLVDFPLNDHAMMSLATNGFLCGDTAITVGMLLGARGFGPVSLMELMCISESAEIHRRASHEQSATPDSPSSDQPHVAIPWQAAIVALTPILAAAKDFRSAKTLDDALRLDLDRLANDLGVGESLASINLDALIGNHGIAHAVIRRLESILTEIPPSWRTVIERRILRSPPDTLEAVGQELSLTRERVRQIQVRVKNKLQSAVGGQITTIANLVRDYLSPILPASELRRTAEDMFVQRDEHSVSVTIAAVLLLDELDYTCRGTDCLSERAIEVVTALRSAAQDAADDVGLCEKADLRESLPDQNWHHLFDQLVTQATLHSVRGRPALRNTGKAHVKAALLEIGRPATKQELAAQVGMTPGKVSAHLSVIPSIARADKDRWGLREWIDDVYEGITAEIVQRINEDGGATPLQRLMEELPRLFGVSESSVRVYARTPYFAIHNGYVSVASEPTLVLRDLDDVVDGRTHEGIPYWRFCVESRHFDGYSIAPFPPELARELGCEPNGSTVADVEYPPDARAVSVSWPLASNTGGSVGRVADALRRLDAKAGDHVRLLIVGPKRVQFRASEADDSDKEKPAPAADILERLKSRRKVF